MKLIMLKGLPASGKSTYARKLADGGYTRVNKDDLRAMLHNSKWSKENEKQVLYIRDEIISHALSHDKSVVVDDTNLAPKHAERLKELAKAYGATFETKFFDETVETCIKRDLDREHSVGEKVIRSMYDQFLAPEPLEYKPDPKLPKAIIVDIDGTLAHKGDRSPYDWGRVGEDTVDDVVRYVVQTYTRGNVILVSGRDEVCRPETEKWLKDNSIPYDALYMRPKDDSRKDTIIKHEIFKNHIEDDVAVDFVLDDRNQVIEMWRSLGLKVLQVADGDF